MLFLYINTFIYMHIYNTNNKKLQRQYMEEGGLGGKGKGNRGERKI